MIVFSDLDGTLLDSKHQLSATTRKAIIDLKQKNIPFVIVSARSPSGIESVLHKYDFNCPIIPYSGALILDEHRHVLYSNGLTYQVAEAVINYIENNNIPCVWNIFSDDRWIVKDKTNHRVIEEEHIVEVEAEQGPLSSINQNDTIHKILCICDVKKIDEIEAQLKLEFLNLSIMKSSAYMLEIMQKGVSKGTAVQIMADHYRIPLSEAIAVGDNYNDVDMLAVVGQPFLMGNAPAPLKERFSQITSDNDNEGFVMALKKLRLID